MVKSEISLATLLEFLARTRDGMPNMVNIDDNPQLATQPEGMLAPFPEDARNYIKEVDSFALFSYSDYDTVYRYPALTRT